MKIARDLLPYLFTWQTGLPVALFATVSFFIIRLILPKSLRILQNMPPGDTRISIADSIALEENTFKARLDRAIWQSATLGALSYGFVTALMFTRFSINSDWWRDSANQTIFIIVSFCILCFIFFILLLTLQTKISPHDTDLPIEESAYVAGFFTMFIALGLKSNPGLFIFSIQHFLCALALLIPIILTVSAVYKIITGPERPAIAMTIYCYLTCGIIVLWFHFVSLIPAYHLPLKFKAIELFTATVTFSRDAVAILLPLFSLAGPVAAMYILFHSKLSAGVRRLIFAAVPPVTLFFLVSDIFPLLRFIKAESASVNLTGFLVFYGVCGIGAGIWYFKALERKQSKGDDWSTEPLTGKETEIKKKPLQPFQSVVCSMAISFFLYPLLVNDAPWFWGAWFATVNILLVLGFLPAIQYLKRHRAGMPKKEKY
ncbi:MAG: hypothetical protein GY765_36965 [bacterium]|nr:hypothetical protein [bacterium]